MNTKSMFSISLMAAVMVGNITIAREFSDEEKQQFRDRAREEGIEFEEKELDRLLRRAHGLPSNPNETPESPKVIYHNEDGGRGVFKGRPRKIEEARIFFDKDASGKPYYRSIAEHFEKNPEFKKVGLVIYQQGWFSDRFEKIGTVVDEAAREKLATTISEHTGFLGRNGKKRGLWCPMQNVFIGGTDKDGKPTGDGKPTRNMCEEYEEFLHREHKTSK